jgi:hypothetical protein
MVHAVQAFRVVVQMWAMELSAVQVEDDCVS